MSSRIPKKYFACPLMVEPSRRRRPPRTAAVLRFSPTAWSKLLFFRDRGDSEVGGFGVTPVDDLLHVRDFLTVRQDATVASVSFCDFAGGNRGVNGYLR